MSLYDDLPPPTQSAALEENTNKPATSWSELAPKDAPPLIKKKDRFQTRVISSADTIDTYFSVPKIVPTEIGEKIMTVNNDILSQEGDNSPAQQMADALVYTQDEYHPWEPNDYSEYVQYKEEQERRRVQLEETRQRFSSLESSNTEKKEPKLSGEAFARKFMEKLGWREGEGLGKERQGINVALSVQKTSTRGGVIIDKSTKRPRITFQKSSESNNNNNNNSAAKQTISRVILLKNMVGRGDVDDSLMQETAEECAKYGIVDNCFIYEVKEDVSDEEAVRIFIQFSSFDAASSALADLDGRFFGGRQVKAMLYSEDRYIKNDFSPGRDSVLK